ncbi:MAG: hypothetical protein IT452_24210 [Planctomycetia bacterium]|nr:hypothetical protein [Planctomycetia bacterium]
MRRLTAAFLAAALAGCGDSGGRPAAPIRTTVVEDEVGGYRVAVPEGWVREVLPVNDPRRRWFAGTWKPASVALPVEAVMVHLMSPGCPAAEIGTHYGGAPFASDPDPKEYAVVGSAPGTVGKWPSFRIEGRYKSARFGEVFEAGAYVETAERSGVFVTSRGPAGTEEATRARLDAALGGLEPVKRVVREGKAGVHPGGISIGFPEGFDEYFGPSPHGSAAYAVGASDVQGRQETVTLLVGPPVEVSEQFLGAMVSEATNGFKPGETLRATIAGQEVQVATWLPADGAPRYEFAAAKFRLGGTPSVLLVQAAMVPPGRAMEVLLRTSATVSCAPPARPASKPVTFGEGGSREAVAPEGWTLSTDTAVLSASLEEAVPAPAGPEGPKTRQYSLIEATLDDDSRINGTPIGAAREVVQSFSGRKIRSLLPEEFALPDGRSAVRVVAATHISYEIFLFCVASPGTLARVHVASVPGLTGHAMQLGVETLAATRFVPFDRLPIPAEEARERARRELPALLERGRKRAAGESWYLEGSGGKEVGGQHVAIAADGSWTDRERRPAKSGSVESRMEGRAGAYSERVQLRQHGKDPSGKAVTVEERIETRLETDGKWITISRTSGQSVPRTDRTACPDLFVPPDLSASDGLLVALAGAPEGSYAFSAVNERYLIMKWREYRVMGEEEVKVSAGTFRARRIEAGAKSIYWVAGGRVVKAELGGFTRELAPQSACAKYLEE